MRACLEGSRNQTAHFEFIIAVSMDLSIRASRVTNCALSEKNREWQDTSSDPASRELHGYRDGRYHPPFTYVTPFYPVCIQVPNSNRDTGGSVHPTSRSPFYGPSINPNLLASPIDFSIMRTAVRQARKFVASAPNAFKDWVVELVDPELSSDSDMNEWIRATAVTVSHCMGTSAMSPRGAGWGVVDPDLRVKGVRGLMVVDASVLVIVLFLFFG